MSNLDQIKGMIKIGLECVAMKMMSKDIHDTLNRHNLKSIHPKKKIRLFIGKQKYEILSIHMTGISTYNGPSVLTNPEKKIKLPKFYKYENLNPLQLWLLAYVFIPDLAEKEESI